MLIPREIIEEIVYRTEIDELIGSYVTLKRAGSNFNGLCPFHSEKTPSFTVFPNSRSFYCFGCGVGGDVISFVMRAENLDYVAAVEFLAARAGITIPQRDEPKDGSGMSRKRVFEMNLAAAKFFRQCLFDPTKGRPGMAYLAEQRGLSPSVIKHFGLGYSPDSFGELRTHMRGLGFTDRELVEGFLCGISKKNGSAYDYFRNRVMFPIIDVSGNIIAFGGRVLDDSKPKYLNSSDTPGFKKSRNLFALNYAKNHCAEEIILCEGYMDVIALHAAGFENAVATLGTAITAEQARILAKYTKKVILSYDSDAAGQTATAKAMRLLGEVGLEVRVLKLNGAKDPDEYIKKFGASRFLQVLRQSKTGFDFKMDAVFDTYDITLPDDRIKASNDICRIIADTPSAVERAVYIEIAAGKLSLPPDVIKNTVQLIIKRKADEFRQKQSRDAQLSIRNIGDRVNMDAARGVGANAAEEVILALLLVYDEHRSAVVDGRVPLREEDFFTAFGKKLFRAIMDLQRSEGGFLLSLLNEEFTMDETSRIQKLIRDRSALSQNGLEVLSSAVKSLKDWQSKANAGEEDKWTVLRKRQEELRAKRENQSKS